VSESGWTTFHHRPSLRLSAVQEQQHPGEVVSPPPADRSGLVKPFRPLSTPAGAAPCWSRLLLPSRAEPRRSWRPVRLTPPAAGASGGRDRPQRERNHPDQRPPGIASGPGDPLPGGRCSRAALGAPRHASADQPSARPPVPDRSAPGRRRPVPRRLRLQPLPALSNYRWSWHALRQLRVPQSRSGPVPPSPPPRSPPRPASPGQPSAPGRPGPRSSRPRSPGSHPAAGCSGYGG